MREIFFFFLFFFCVALLCYENVMWTGRRPFSAESAISSVPAGLGASLNTPSCRTLYRPTGGILIQLNPAIFPSPSARLNLFRHPILPDFFPPEQSVTVTFQRIFRRLKFLQWMEFGNYFVDKFFI